MDSILSEVRQMPQALVDELETDLYKLINKHSYIQVSPVNSPCQICSAVPPTASSYHQPILRRDFWNVQVVNAACKALATLAKHADSTAEVLTANAQNYFAALQQCQNPSTAPAYFSRQAIVS